MLNVKVSKSDPTDLYEQVAAEIRRAIADGEAKPGERLPPARDLAAELGVNTNTVLRSLRLLRDEGLLEFRRGRGISVAGTPERGAVVQKARDLVEFARRHVNNETWLPAWSHITAKGRTLLFRPFDFDVRTDYTDYKKWSVDTKVTFEGPTKP